MGRGRKARQGDGPVLLAVKNTGSEDESRSGFRPLPGCVTLGQPLALSESWVWLLGRIAQAQPGVIGFLLPALLWAQPFPCIISINSRLILGGRRIPPSAQAVPSHTVIPRVTSGPLDTLDTTDSSIRIAPTTAPEMGSLCPSLPPQAT